MAHGRAENSDNQPVKGLVHGTSASYCHGGCRCDACRLANTVYHRELRKRLRERINNAKARVPHGTAGGYANHGCRCEDCRTAHHKAMATAYARRRAQRGDVA